MLSIRIPNVKEIYFPNKVLTPLRGQPTYESLKTLNKQLKANAASVPSTLGGGLYGHLGLIMSPQRYATLANAVPWVTPLPVPPFVAPLGATAAQLEAARDVWRESQYRFDLFHATEKALLAQVVESIDEQYMQTHLDNDTSMFTASLQTILTDLSTNYGNVTPGHISSKQLQVSTMHYDLTMPMDRVFNAIGELGDLAEAGGSLISSEQMMDLAYLILSKVPMLQQELLRWHRRPALAKTWPNMLIHFRAAQRDLNSLPSVTDMFHQANGAMMTSMADMVTQRLLEAYPPPVLEPPPTTPAASVPPSHAEANSSIMDTAMLAQLGEYFATLNPPAHQRNHRNDRNTQRNNRNDRHNDRNSRTRGPGRSFTNNQHQSTVPFGRGGRASSAPPTNRDYCWTHGACAHSSNVCNTQLPGHITTATFANMQGGNTNGCFWLPA
jgi:hypothetical protein